MRAFVQTGEDEAEIRTVERPEPGPREVRIDVQAAGLCGSDVHALHVLDGFEFVPIPRIMGHEYAGVIDAVGEAVSRFAPGDRVVEEPIHDCGVCFQCDNGQPNACRDTTITGMHTDGAFTGATTVGERHVHRVPDGVPIEHAAVAEPLSVAVRAVAERSTIEPGSTVLVEGPGPIGVFTALVADASGASVLVSGLGSDATHRLPLLESCGIATVNTDDEDLGARVEAFTDGVGCDVVVDATGHESGVEIATEHVRKGGQIVVVGMPGAPSELFLTPLVRAEVGVDPSYGSTWSDVEGALRLMETGDVDVGEIVDYPLGLDDVGETMEAFEAGETCKAVFDLSGE
jgi:L-iditol 2-dehydrogenase